MYQIKKTLCATLLSATVTLSFIPAQAQANDDMIKLMIESQGLSSEQAELALTTIKSVKSIAEDVSTNKVKVVQFFSQVAEKDHLDVKSIMNEYRQWESEFDVKLEKALRAASELHGELTVEQRKVLLEKLQRLSR